MAKYSGKLGKATLNGTDFHVTSWEATEENSTVETTDTGTSGFRTHEKGLESANGSFDFVLDDSNMPDDRGLTNGDDITNLVLVIADTAKNFTFPVAIVDNVTYRSSIDAAVTGSATFKSDGTFTRPT